LVKLSDFAGQIVVLDFWVIGSPSYIKAMPDIQRIEQKYKGKKVHFLHVNVLDSKQAIQDFITNQKYNTFRVFLDTTRRVYNHYRCNSSLTTILIDSKGKVRFRTNVFDGNHERKIETMIEIVKEDK
jgi:peroxiredoxin